MTPEDAIKTIEVAIAEVEWNHPMDYAVAFETAISAIEKQIPKEPKKKEENQYSTFYDCPCCGGYLVSKIDGDLCGGQEYKYCYRCGQALKWSDNK